MSTVEFSRPFRIDTLGDGDRGVEIAAEPAERAALVERFGLVSLDALSATATLRREGERVFAEGRIKAVVAQACVATGEPVPSTVDEAFTLRFVPEGEGGEEEIELDAEDCDVVDYAGGSIDLGEAVAETMMLSLDPFPRSDGADAVLRQAGVLSEDEVVSGPFAALKALKDKLG